MTAHLLNLTRGPQSPLRTNKYLAHLTPHPKQAAFLLASHLYKEVLFGGAAGPGKSWALVYAACQYADVPGYSAILFRRTLPQIKGEGGLWPKAKEMLRGVDGVRFNENELKIVFDSGAVVKFASLPHPWSGEAHDGLEYQFVGFDEGTHFEKRPWSFLGSRMRAPLGLNVPIRQVMTSNPGGPGHDWVKARFGCGTNDSPQPKCFYVPATIRDNPSLDIAAYEEQLAKLSPVLRAQKLDGNWDIVAEGPLWGEADFKRYDLDPRALADQHPFARIITCWDCKNKVSTSVNVRRGESFVSGTVWLLLPGRLYLLDEEHGPYGLDDTIKAFYRLANRWPRAVHYIEDKAMGPELIRWVKRGGTLKYDGRDVKHPRVSGVNSHTPLGKKEIRTEAMQPFIKAGDLFVPNELHHPWVKEWLSELARAPHAPNDRTDTAVMAVEHHLLGRDDVARGMSTL